MDGAREGLQRDHVVVSERRKNTISIDKQTGVRRLGRSRLAKSDGGRALRLGRAMFTISRCCRHHLVDLPLSQKVDWPFAAEAGVAGEHEVHAHARVFD